MKKNNENENDEELLKLFIGQNNEEIINGKFNIPGFLLGSVYFFYRGMLGYGVLLFIIKFFILASAENLLLLTLLFIVSLFTGLYVNKIYISFAKKKVSSIKKLYYDKNYEELKAICTRDGGVSIIYIFLGLFVNGGLYLILLLMLLFN